MRRYSYSLFLFPSLGENLRPFGKGLLGIFCLGLRLSIRVVSVIFIWSAAWCSCSRFRMRRCLPSCGWSILAVLVRWSAINRGIKFDG